MKILYIDPWCANGSNLYYYSTGLVDAMSKHAELSMVVQYNCDRPNNANYTMLKWFFPRSSRMKSGIFRTIIRGIEYLLAYQKILKYAKEEEYDVIHVEWPLLYTMDYKIYSKLRNYCKIFSLKAHNILPHSSNETYVSIFRKIYSVPDIILVHGNSMEKEFGRYFHEYLGKIRIQHDGVLANFNSEFNENDVDEFLKKELKRYNRIYLFVGRIDADKGLERFTQIWGEAMSESNSLLVIAGKATNGYDTQQLRNNVQINSNMLLIEKYISDNLLNYLFFNSDIVVIPYLKGSMSAVATTAAEFSKPVLTTRFGVIEEYVRDNIDGFVVNNDYNDILSMLVTIDKTISSETLKTMGHSLYNHFQNEFSWEQIGEELVNKTYSALLINEK